MGSSCSSGGLNDVETSPVDVKVATSATSVDDVAPSARSPLASLTISIKYQPPFSSSGSVKRTSTDSEKPTCNLEGPFADDDTVGDPLSAAGTAAPVVEGTVSVVAPKSIQPDMSGLTVTNEIDNKAVSTPIEATMFKNAVSTLVDFADASVIHHDIMNIPPVHRHSHKRSLSEPLSLTTIQPVMADEPAVTNAPIIDGMQDSGARTSSKRHHRRSPTLLVGSASAEALIDAYNKQELQEQAKNTELDGGVLEADALKGFESAAGRSDLAVDRLWKELLISKKRIIPGQPSLERIATLIQKGGLSAHEMYNLLNQGVIRPFIQDEFYMLLVDTRDKTLYSQLHIRTARHFSWFMQSVDDLSSFPDVQDFTFVIVYDDEGAHSGNAAKLAQQVSKLKGNYQILTLTCGFNGFNALYPFMCQKTVITNDVTRSRLVSYPSEIEHRRLYLGNHLQAANAYIVDDLSITHIVNASKNHPNKFPDTVQYLRVPVDDEVDSDLFQYFTMICDFLDAAFNDANAVVLVHCTMGVSRSASAVIAYMIKSRRMTCKEAFDFIKDKRQGVRPNRAFAVQLCRWEQHILGALTTDSFEIF